MLIFGSHIGCNSLRLFACSTYLLLLKRLSSVACKTRSVHQEDFIDNALRELSIGLCRGNAVMYRWGQTALARVTGEAIQRGDETPSAGVP